MTSIAVRAEQESDLPRRWAVAIVFAAIVHVVPMFVLTMNRPVPMDEPTTMAVEFTDFSAEDLANAVVTPESAVPPQTPAAQPVAPSPALPPPPPVATPAPPVQAAKPPAQPEPKPPVAQKQPDAKKAIEMDLAPFNPTSAFDESKETKEAPKDNYYLSDRTSTAADKGPKNLPNGDPYIDKGQSREIRAMQKRGEGNLPALASDPKSGSVAKEGNPDAGAGKKIPEKLPDQEQPLAPPALKDKTPQPGVGQITDAAVPAGIKDAPPAAPKPKEEKAVKPEIIREKDGPAPDALSEKPLEPKKPVQAEMKAGPLPGKPEPQPAELAAPLDGNKAVPEQNTSDPTQKAVTAPKKPDAKDELEAFAALLDGKGRTDGRGGDAGAKTGINARAGSRGHEGDGTLRPGHDEAVSDVTSFNLESSAKEFDEARYAKKLDEKSKYFKAMYRRIDGKWKAEISARSRLRLDRGAVVMKIIVRRDGKLLEASEVSRTPKGLPDEAVSICKLAIERASEPLSDPFPIALQQHEKLEAIIGFLY